MTSDVRRVDLLGLPLDLHRDARERSRTLQRELALVHAAAPVGDVRSRLLWLAQELADRYASFRVQPSEALERALRDGLATVDLAYELPVDAADAAEELCQVLDEVDQLCASGELVTLVAPAAEAAYRRWLLGEFVRQLRDGDAPRAWAWDDAGRTTDPPSSETAGAGSDDAFSPDDTARLVVAGDLDLEGAAHVRDDVAVLLERGARRLVFDLSRCDFVDSVGISLLLTTRDRLQRTGGQALISHAVPAVRRALEIAGVFELLTEPAAPPQA